MKRLKKLSIDCDYNEAMRLVDDIDKLDMVVWVKIDNNSTTVEVPEYLAKFNSGSNEKRLVHIIKTLNLFIEWYNQNDRRNE